MAVQVKPAAPRAATAAAGCPARAPILHGPPAPVRLSSHTRRRTPVPDVGPGSVPSRRGRRSRGNRRLRPASGLPAGSRGGPGRTSLSQPALAVDPGSVFGRRLFHRHQYTLLEIGDETAWTKLADSCCMARTRCPAEARQDLRRLTVSGSLSSINPSNHSPSQLAWTTGRPAWRPTTETPLRSTHHEI